MITHREVEEVEKVAKVGWGHWHGGDLKASPLHCVQGKLGGLSPKGQKGIETGAPLALSGRIW